MLESFKTNPCEHSVKVGPESEIKSFAEEVLAKKTKIIKTSYISTSFIPPTSNVVERLFSLGKKVFAHDRANLSPTHFEMQMFLFVNRSYWDIEFVNLILVE